MAVSRRCSQCGTDWPYRSEYNHCPFCETETWECSRTTPLTHTEAQQLIAKQREEYQRLEDNERKMDAAYDAWFLREHGIAPLDEPAKHGQCLAPLSEFLPL